MDKSTKFKFWSKSNKTFSGPYTLETFGKIIVEAPSIVIDFENFELVYSTGLVDMNGKEIYSDDILKFTFPPSEKHPKKKPVVHYHKVYWNPQQGQWWKEMIGASQFAAIGRNSETHEVAGNIFENPDLFNKSFPC